MPVKKVIVSDAETIEVYVDNDLMIQVMIYPSSDPFSINSIGLSVEDARELIDQIFDQIKYVEEHE